jgi:hypothetical protein
MQQLRQRVIASYHLGPMDVDETRAYIEHRLATVGWRGDPSFSDDAHAAVFAYSGGIPRKVNTLMDRVLLMGYLEELHAFTEEHITTVIRDISDEFRMPNSSEELLDDAPPSEAQEAVLRGGEVRMADTRSGDRRASTDVMDERLMRLEKSVVSVLSILKKMVGNQPGVATPGAAPSGAAQPAKEEG